MFESTQWVLEEPNVSDDTKFDLVFPTIVRPPNVVGEFQYNFLQFSNILIKIKLFNRNPNHHRRTSISGNRHRA